MYGMSGSFFTNDKVVLGRDYSQRITSPANSREGGATIFKVPEHTIGTASLFIYVDGKLKIPDVDYVDINSEEIEMNYEVPVEHSVDAVLIVSIGDGEELQWGSF